METPDPVYYPAAAGAARGAARGAAAAARTEATAAAATATARSLRLRGDEGYPAKPNKPPNYFV